LDGSLEETANGWYNIKCGTLQFVGQASNLDSWELILEEIWWQITADEDVLTILESNGQVWVDRIIADLISYDRTLARNACLKVDDKLRVTNQWDSRTRVLLDENIVRVVYSWDILSITKVQGYIDDFPASLLVEGFSQDCNRGYGSILKHVKVSVVQPNVWS